MGREVRLLTLDDSVEFVTSLLGELRSQGYRPLHFHVRTAEALGLALAEHPWDLVVADYSMPHFRAAKALEIIRQKGLDLPVVVVSETMGREVALAALKAGAQDYLLKEQVSWIGLVMERTLREADERRARRKAEEALRQSVAPPATASEGPEGLVVVCDVRGNVTACSDELLGLLGYEPDDVVGRNWIQYFLPREDRERAEEAFLETVTKGATQGYLDCHVVTLLGKRCPVRWRNAALLDAEGRIVGTAAIGRERAPERPAPARATRARSEAEALLSVNP